LSDDPYGEKAVAERVRRARDVIIIGALIAAFIMAIAILQHGLGPLWLDELRWFFAGCTVSSAISNVAHYLGLRREAQRHRQAVAGMQEAAAAFAEMVRRELIRRGVDVADVEAIMEGDPRTTTRH
jgi:hypothetical protein